MTGRTIPVTRTDGSEVAGEATQALIKAKTDNLDIALSALRDALIGTGSKTLTDLWNELASTLAVSDSTSHTTLANILTALGPLATDAKLEAVRALLAGTLNVSGPLTDTQLRAAAVAISAASLPLPSGAATDAKLEAIRALLAGTLAVSAASLPLPSGAATSANQTTANTSLANILTALGLLATAAQLPSSLGSKTAAGSLSVTGASDGVFYVGGVSADGVAPTDQAVRVSGIDAGGLKRTLATDTSGYQYAKQLPIVSVALNLAATNDTAQIAVPDGYNSWCVNIDTGTISGTLTFQYTRNGGTTWQNQVLTLRNSIGQPAATTTSTGVAWEGEIPAGSTHVRVFATSISSGSATGGIYLSPATTATTTTVAAYGQSSNARIGFISASGIWYDDTSAALTANSTFTSTARDVVATSSGSTFSSGNTYSKEFRVLAEQDVAFTLQIQASRDNSTFRVVQSITATNISGGGYVAEAVVNPKWRYYRYAIVNGASNAARTTGGSVLFSN